MRKNWNYVLTVATVVARSENGAMSAPSVGSGGVCSQAVGFVSVRLAGICVLSRREDVFTFNLVYKDMP
jgi:hypothetical protein